MLLAWGMLVLRGSVGAGLRILQSRGLSSYWLTLSELLVFKVKKEVKE